MTTLEIPDLNKTTTDREEIHKYLTERGIIFERWQASAKFDVDADQETVLSAYEHSLKPYMEKNGYQTADVIRILPTIENLDAIRAKFLSEHTHSEDEVRFFVEGKGAFWFNLSNDNNPDEPVFVLICEAGDLISVPAGTKHWFDMGANPKVTAIRVFTNPEGWVANYTGSDVAERYNKPYEQVL